MRKHGDRIEEYKAAREVLEADVDGDGDDDIVAVYRLNIVTSANAGRQDLAVFIMDKGRVKKTYETVLSKHDISHGTLRWARNGEIALDTMSEAPDDPSCCPSVEGELYCALKRKRIVCNTK